MMKAKLFLLTGVSLLLFALTGCVQDTAMAPAPALITPPLMAFNTTTVQRGDLVEGVVRTGITRYVSQPLSFDRPVAGFGQFLVEPGEFVTEGQLLLTLDTTHLDAQIEAQVARIADMQRDHRLATDMRQLDIDIMRLEGASSASIERAQMELRQQRARKALQLNHAEIRLEDLHTRRQAAELHAPFDGRITNMININLGNYVAVGRPLIFITDGSEVIIDAIDKPFMDNWGNPPPGELPPDPWRPNTVRQAVLMQAHLNGQVYDIQYIPVAFEERDARPVRFTVLTDTPLPAGEYVEIYFYRRFMEDVLLLPDNALFSPANQPYVYRVIDGELVFTEVRLAGRTNLMAAVAEGLEAGDVVFVR
jgi:RND family efflux transporter MFP subunit